MIRLSVSRQLPQTTGQTQLSALERRVRRELFAATPPLTVSQWAESFRWISQEHNPEESGPWRNERVPYLREVMDALSDPDIERVVFRKSARVGGTEVLNNFVGWSIDQRPRPMLVLLPTVEEAKGWSKEALDPMLRDTDRLRGRIWEGDTGRRRKESTIQYKRFSGGYMAIVGANAGAGLRRRSIAYILASEIDGFPLEARGGRGKEGDPLTLGIRRSQNVRSRKIYLESTPTEKPSRICREYEQSDQREYWVPCPHCGHYQTLKWANFEWRDRNARTVVYRCGDYDRHPDGTVTRIAGCGESIEEHHKSGMLAKGEWRPRFAERRTRGYFIWAGYSPLTTWERLVDEWLKAQGDRTQLKGFVNTILGEEWEETEAELDQHVLAARRERWPARVPASVGLLTCGVDVQGDRLETSVWGWAAGEEAYVIRHEILIGNPGQADVWNRLDAFLAQGWEHEAGVKVPIRATCIDSGHHTDEVYAFVRARPGRNIFPIKGSTVHGAQAVMRASKPAGAGVALITLGTDALKDSLFSRLQVSQAGQKFVHFAWDLPDEYFDELTSERARIRYVNRRLVRVYELEAGRSNEALDCAVYALAALYLLGPYRQQLGNLAEALARGEQPAWPGAKPGRHAGRRILSRGVE